jgi:hypothetical protein
VPRRVVTVPVRTQAFASDTLAAASTAASAAEVRICFISFSSKDAPATIRPRRMRTLLLPSFAAILRVKLDM